MLQFNCSSGRCQIIHWRQGHKDECRPYVAVKPVKDVSGSHSQQEDDKDSNATSADKKQPGNGPTFESSSEDYSTFSTPRRSSIESSSVTSAHSDVTSENFVTVESFTSPIKVDQNKSTHNDENIQHTFSAASSRPDDVLNGPSFFEPSTTPSGFWGGTLHSRKSTTDELHDLSKNTTILDSPSLNGSNSSSPVDDAPNMPSFSKPSTASSAFCGGTLPSKKSTVDELDGSNKNTTILDNPAPNVSRSKKSNDDISMSKEILVDSVVSTKTPKYISETLKQRDAVGESGLPHSLFKETKISSSPVKDFKAFGGMPSAIPKKSSHVVNTKTISSPPIKSTSRLASQYTKPVTVHEEKSKVSICSSKLADHSDSGRNERKPSMLKVVDQNKPSKLPRQCSQSAESETAHKYSCKV